MSTIRTVVLGCPEVSEARTVVSGSGAPSNYGAVIFVFMSTCVEAALSWTCYGVIESVVPG